MEKSENIRTCTLGLKKTKSFIESYAVNTYEKCLGEISLMSEYHPQCTFQGRTRENPELFEVASVHCSSLILLVIRAQLIDLRLFI